MQSKYLLAGVISLLWIVQLPAQTSPEPKVLGASDSIELTHLVEDLNTIASLEPERPEQSPAEKTAAAARQVAATVGRGMVYSVQVRGFASLPNSPAVSGTGLLIVSTPIPTIGVIPNQADLLLSVAGFGSLQFYSNTYFARFLGRDNTPGQMIKLSNVTATSVGGILRLTAQAITGVTSSNSFFGNIFRTNNSGDVPAQIDYGTLVLEVNPRTNQVTGLIDFYGQQRGAIPWRPRYYAQLQGFAVRTMDLPRP